MCVCVWGLVVQVPKTVRPMPASERQSYRSSGNTGPLYPTLPLMDIEMRDLEEDRVRF